MRAATTTTRSAAATMSRTRTARAITTTTPTSRTPRRSNSASNCGRPLGGVLAAASVALGPGLVAGRVTGFLLEGLRFGLLLQDLQHIGIGLAALQRFPGVFRQRGIALVNRVEL